MTQRSEIRHTMRQRRRDLDPSTKQLWDMLIFQRAHKDVHFLNARAIHVYRSTVEEIDTWPFIEYAWAIGKQVYCPRIIGDPNLGLMEHVLVSPHTTWTTHRRGVIEPIVTLQDSVREHHEFTYEDVILVPVLAFDHSGYRLGYGGGYYDRFLVDAAAHTIGLAYQFQRVSSVYPEPHDQPLLRIATEERWYDFPTSKGRMFAP